jgi:hypothetical protein
MVPPLIRAAVWASYRPGQCVDRRPSESWMIAADAAIDAVWQAEGRPAFPRRPVRVGPCSDFQSSPSSQWSGPETPCDECGLPLLVHVAG